MPSFCRRSVEASLEETAASKVCFIAANWSIKQLVVEPVPTPTMLLLESNGAIFLIAAAAAFTFCWWAGSTAYDFSSLMTGSYRR